MLLTNGFIFRSYELLSRRLTAARDFASAIGQDALAHGHDLRRKRHQRELTEVPELPTCAARERRVATLTNIASQSRQSAEISSPWFNVTLLVKELQSRFKFLTLRGFSCRSTDSRRPAQL